MKKTKKILAILCLCTVVLTSLTACKKDKQVDGEDNDGTENSVVTTEEVLQPEILNLTFENVAMQNANFVYDLIFENIEESEINITNDDILLPDGFNANVYVASDPSEPTIRSVVFSGIEAEPGIYTIKIADNVIGTPHSFDIIVNSVDMSKYVQLSCSTSDPEISDGETLTVMAKYTGVQSTKFVTINLTEDKIKLYNCTGEFAFSQTNEGLDICIAVRNIHAIDKTQDCYLEILSGSAYDVDGKPVNGTKIKFNVL